MDDRKLYLIMLLALFLVGLICILTMLTDDIERLKRATAPRMVWTAPRREKAPQAEPGGPVEADLEPMPA